MAAMTCVRTEPDVVVATVVFIECPAAIARCAVERFGGRVWTSTRDTLMATFDAPSRAIRCMNCLRALGLRVRAGMHAGQLAIYGDCIEGVAVQRAADVLDAAGDGGVLVSRTVAELVAGSDLDLVDQGAVFLVRDATR